MRPGPVFCFSGTAAGYGQATLIGSVTGAGPPSIAGCYFDAHYVATITLVDGSTLMLTASGTVCPFGNSGNAPDSPNSYGNPNNVAGSFAITSGRRSFRRRDGKRHLQRDSGGRCSDR
jgi:hypothetical protein